MKSICNAVLLVPVLAVGLAGNGFAAQPRGDARYFESRVPQTEEARRAEKTAEMEAWLRRLVGRFRVDIPMFPKITNPDASARLVDCVNIGTGVGVHCIFYSSRPREAGNGQAAGTAQQEGADGPLRRDEVLRVSKVVEYGLDANAGKIRMMVATERSVQRVDGTLNGNTVVSMTRCWDSRPMPPCSVMQWIKGSDEDKDIWVHEQHVRSGFGYRYVLLRMSGEEAAEAERFIEGAREERSGNGRPAGKGVRRSGGRLR